MNRKEVKSHGTKKLIEGVYEQGGRALIIEDVVTTGTSILETTKALRNEGLIVEDVICVLNREQGGEEALRKDGIRLHSVLKVGQILNHLLKVGQISDNQLAEIREALRNPKKPPSACGSCATSSWSLNARSHELRKNPLNTRLLDVMLKKKSNLCVAIDLPEATRVLEVARQVQDHVCAVKLHSDSLIDADDQFFAEIRQLAQSGQFFLFEDR